jgi:predicted ATPase/class 3 adenylate cyclase
MNLPSDSLTFLFTDIEGSTKLWEAYPQWMAEALARHNTILRQIIETHNGHVFKTVGDAFCAVFPSAPEALHAAIAAQIVLLAEAWDHTPGEHRGASACLPPASVALRVRMALHTGTADRRDADYFGPTLNRIARLLAIGHGEQILLSQSTHAQLRTTLPHGITLQDMGAHRLKDLQQPEHVYQVCHPALPTTFPPLCSLQAFANNLPQQLTSFIGRQKEIADIKRLLPTTRLLTLTGTGGTGKTRLALQVGAETLEEYGDGVWLVECAALADPALIPQTIAAVFGLREEPRRTMLQTLITYLRPKALLLLLDNCEHLIEHCAHVAETLLQQCPHLCIVTTSRETLGVPGETTWRVPCLSLPDPTPTGSRSLRPAALAEYEAVRLFVERASASYPAFALTEQNAAAVVQVCARLDGIPLALELAAAQVKALTVEQIAARLDDRFRLLTRGSRTALPRQQTLRALFDWSYDLLAAAERALLMRLSVFAAGWTLEAAEVVCGETGDAMATGSRLQTDPASPSPAPIEAWDVQRVLLQLVEKSLILYEAHNSMGRYRLLETVQQYSRDKLYTTGMAEAMYDRHLAYFLAFAEVAAPQLQGPEQTEWYERLETEHDNLRGALEWALSKKEDGWRGSSSPDPALRMVKALKLFWCLRGYFAEGQAWVARALEQGRSASLALRARVFNTGGVLAWFQADYALLRRYCEQTLVLATTAGERWSQAAAFILLGSGAAHEGEYARATLLLEQSVPLAQEVGDPWLIAQSLHHSAVNALYRGDLESATTCADGALAVSRTAGDTWTIALATRTLGFIAFARKDYAAATVSLQTAIQLQQALRYKWGLAVCLEGLACIFHQQGRVEDAVRLFGVAEALREATGMPLPPQQRGSYDDTVSALRTALSEAPFAALWAEGRAMSLEQAIRSAVEPV